MIENISPDFTSGVATGTEYIQVGMSLSLRAELEPNANAETHFIGRVFAFRTADPDRYPLTGKTSNQLQVEADLEGSMISSGLYNITSDGLFVSERGMIVPELTLCALPLTNLAYNWRRIGVGTQQNPAYTPAAPEVCFMIEGAVGTKFHATYASVWQVEKYSSHRVTRNTINESSDSGHSGGSGGISALDAVGTVAGTVIPGAGLIPALSHLFGGYAVIPHPTKNSRPKQPIKAPDTPSNPKPIRGPGLPPPRSVHYVDNHLRRCLGIQLHPLVAPFSVLSAAGENPGVWSQIATMGSGCVKNILADPKTRALLDEHGPRAMDALERKTTGDGFWSKAGSAALDIVKLVGPIVASMML
jgi:hypothetical protein